MATTIIGVLLIITFLGLVYYCVKGHNLMVGFFFMSSLWIILPYIGNLIEPQASMEGVTFLSMLEKVFGTSPSNYCASALVSIFMGAFFGRVLMETGIASTVIRKTVELGGNRPAVTLVLISIVSTACFTSMTGIGPVVALGVIILPIFMSLGISSTVSMFAYMASIMAGSWVNVVYYNQYGAAMQNLDPRFADYTYDQFFQFGIVALVIALVVSLTVALIGMKKKKVAHAWAAVASDKVEQKDAPWYSWISIVLPILFIVLVKLPILLAFALSALYALLTCGKLKGKYTDICGMLSRIITEGVVDSAPLIGFVLILSTFSGSASYAAPYFKAVLGGIFPSSALALCLLYAALIPLGMFRSPMTLTGGGAVMCTIVLATANWNPVFVFPLFLAATIAPQFLDLTQSWVSWAFSYTKVSSKDYMKYSVPTIWITGALICIATYLLYGSVALV